MNFKLILACAVSALSAVSARADYHLWYQQPASEWMEAVPTGNGRLAAMVYGGISKETLALNEITLWAGQPDSTNNNIGGREHLDEARRCFFEGDPEQGNRIGEKYFTGLGRNFGTHLPLGDLTIDFTHPSDIVTGYRRELDLDSALAVVTYNCGGINYRRECLADYPDDVIAMRITADKPGAVSAVVGLNLLRRAAVRATDNGLWLEGKVSFGNPDVGGVSFCGGIRLLHEGGTLTAGDSTVSVTGADALTVIIDVRTDYNRSDYKELCRTTLDKAEAKAYATLKASHTADYRALFSRMDISLGNAGSNDTPTDVRLRLAKAGVADPSFDALFFQYGRYMLISSSRPNGTPLCANLQGVWNDNGACNMSWTCDYHLDINTQQNYWSANRANLAECNEPLFDYIAFLAKNGAETARKVYGCRGWVAHTMCNAWGYTAPGWSVSWGLNVTGGAWIATHLWSHYLYTRDKEWLAKTGYPLLKETALFFIDYMTEDPATGYLVTGPSISPEIGYVSPKGNHLSLAMMPTLDRAIVYDIYSACIESSKILGVDKSLRRRLEKDIKRLPPLMIGADGQLQEWLADVKRSDPAHRHSSHIMTLFPYNQISYTRTPDLAAAARKGLEIQTSAENWEDTEWSTANMLCFYARLKDGQTAYGWLQNLFRRFMRENLMTVSPKGVALAEYDIFSFDATEAGVAGICEMLMQSYDGFIEFLPALPKEWADGSVKGLCAEGGLVIDMKWRGGKMLSARLTATVDGTFTVKGINGKISLRKGETRELDFTK